MALPTGYIQAEYIESSGAQWIDTGVMGSNNAYFEIDFLTKNTVGSSNFGTILGAFVSTSTRINLGTWNDNEVTTGGEMCWGGGYYNSYITSNKRIQISVKGTTLTTPNGTQTIDGSTFNSGSTIGIFARNCNGVADQFSKTQLYSLKMYNGSTLVRDFVPCINSGGDVGLYDLVNGTFYMGKGSGTLTACVYIPMYGNVTVDGSSKAFKSGYVNVNGIWRKITKTLVNVGGIWRNADTTKFLSSTVTTVTYKWKKYNTITTKTDGWKWQTGYKYTKGASVNSKVICPRKMPTGENFQVTYSENGIASMEYLSSQQPVTLTYTEFINEIFDNPSGSTLYSYCKFINPSTDWAKDSYIPDPNLIYTRMGGSTDRTNPSITLWAPVYNPSYSYSQGSYISDVTSTNSSAYPTNGRHSDGYWYVRQ